MIVAVYGSPRKGGNTDILMNEFLKPVEKKEEVKRFYLRDLNIKPCVSCGGCHKTGVCVFKDDIWSIYENVEKADGLVLSSPIFFLSISAQLKTFVDRAQPFWARKYLLRQKSASTGKGFFISVGAVKTEQGIETAKVIEKCHMNTLNIKYAGELFFNGVDGKAKIMEVPGALEQAYQAGVNFVGSTI